MVAEVYSYDVTVPHGTLSTTPQVTTLAMPVRIIRWVEIIVPPGPAGRVGLRVASNRTQVIPVNVGAWLTNDNEKLRVDLETRVQSGAWQLIAYNTGIFDHTVTVRFGVDLAGVGADAGRLQPLAL